MTWIEVLSLPGLGSDFMVGWCNAELPYITM
jgi:hypothetical protein